MRPRDRSPKTSGRSEKQHQKVCGRLHEVLTTHMAPDAPAQMGHATYVLMNRYAQADPYYNSAYVALKAYRALKCDEFANEELLERMERGVWEAYAEFVDSHRFAAFLKNDDEELESAETIGDEE